MSNNIIKFKKQLPEIKIIEKFSPDITEFENKEEFIEYLQSNKEDMDKLTTQKLNKMYHIKGYKITKLKGEICLKKDTSCRGFQSCNTATEDKNENRDNTEINELKQEIQTLKSAFTNLLNKLVENKIIEI